MFVVNDDLSIYATRGDIVFFSVTAEDEGVPYHFNAGDVVRFKVYGKKDVENIVLQKDFPVLETTEEVEIFLEEEDTRIGEIISKPKDYWYEVELNPYNNPQTIIGYDDDGAKVFKLFPEGADIPEWTPDPEDYPVVDEELDMTSPRPVQNRAVASAVARLRSDVATVKVYATPEMYGAVGDGIVDDTVALQKALNSGNPVVLSPRNYRTTETLEVPTGCTISGDRNCIISPDCETAFHLNEKTVLSGFSVYVRSEKVLTVFEVDDNSTTKDSLLEIVIENMSVYHSTNVMPDMYTVCHFHTAEKGIYDITVRGCTFDNYPAGGYVARAYSEGGGWLSTVTFDGNYSRAFKWHYFFDKSDSEFVVTHKGQHIVTNCTAQCNPITNGFIYIPLIDSVYAQNNVTWDWGSSTSGSINCPGRPYVIPTSILNEDVSFTNTKNLCDIGYTGSIALYDGTAFSFLPNSRQDVVANLGGHFNSTMIPKFVGLSRDNAILLYDGTNNTQNASTRIRFYWVDGNGITYVSVVPSKKKMYVSQPISNTIYFGLSTDGKRLYVYREEGTGIPSYTGIMTMPTDGSLTMAINEGGSGMVERTPNCYEFLGKCYYSSLPEEVENLTMVLAQPSYVSDDNGAIYSLKVVENADGNKELSITRAWTPSSEMS